MPNSPNVVTIDNPPGQSKINITQVVSMIFGLAASFGIFIPPEWQTIVLQVIVFSTPIITMVFRTWFTGKEATTPQLVAALEDKGKKVTVVHKKVKP